MPKPCAKPLTPNPFETYRDPLTGQWKVKYPSNAQSTAVLSSPPQADEGTKKRSASCRRREKSSATKEVA
ncbi:MAG: hypothetical protein WBB01_20245 [Phormidesmis sp.]